MANANSTDSEFRSGAKSAHAAIVKIIKAANELNSPRTVGEDFLNGLSGSGQLIENSIAGKSGAFRSGFFAGIAEYVGAGAACGEVNLDLWRPFAAMNEKERVMALA